MAANRIIIRDKFDGTGYTNENSLANAMLTKPDVINPVVTHLAGMESKKFPLTFLTEGQKGGYKTIELNDIEYTWDVIGRMKYGSKIVSHTYGGSDKPGLGFSYFYLTFDTNWIKNQHLLSSPNGQQAQVKGEPVQVGSYWQYKLQINGSDPAEYIAASEIAAGQSWVMTGGAPVSESDSMGNASNFMTPGKIKNQISIIRKSYRYGGNVVNKMVEVQLNADGKITNYWMPFQEWQFHMQWRQEKEEHLWTSKYNRLTDGTIPNIDPVSGLPIPIGAGVDQQIPNRDTYSFLTYKKLKNTVGDVLYGATDSGNMTVDLFTGVGGIEEFSDACADKASGFQQVAGDKFIKGEGRNLMLTGFFAAFEHVDGHVVRVHYLSMNDFGSRAENAPKHPISGKPITSYDMYFLDRSVYDGEPNLKMLSQKGRSMVRGIVKGMAPDKIGINFEGNSMPYIATEKDSNSVHLLSSCGICIRRNVHCFKLSCSLT